MGHKENWGVMSISIIFIMVVVSWMYKMCQGISEGRRGWGHDQRGRQKETVIHRMRSDGLKTLGRVKGREKHS